ncbi:uncharacterized protein METZ01_LOCUS329202 [marine metagenome]|uniref:Uncharacterized protein n=1 Tax=marine metagenome TaxID=408172 RepID=A0A382PUR4_9ZZZZ
MIQNTEQGWRLGSVNTSILLEVDSRSYPPASQTWGVI